MCGGGSTVLFGCKHQQYCSLGAHQLLQAWLEMRKQAPQKATQQSLKKDKHAERRRKSTSKSLRGRTSLRACASFCRASRSACAAARLSSAACCLDCAAARCASSACERLLPPAQRRWAIEVYFFVGGYTLKIGRALLNCSMFRCAHVPVQEKNKRKWGSHPGTSDHRSTASR